LTSLSGSNVVVAYQSWQGFAGQVALVVSGANNVYLHDLDFANNGGDIFLINCTGQIRIENIRAKNTGDGTIGSGHSNVIQLNNTWDNGTGGIRTVQALGGKTEDMISIYQSGGIDSTHPLIIENNHLESPLPPDPQAWSSSSGSGMMLADVSGHDIIARDNTLLNVGQVGIGIPYGTRVHVLNNIVYGARRAANNVGIYTPYTGGPAYTGNNEVANNRIYWFDANGSPNPVWDGGLSGAIIGWNTNILQDTTIDPNTLHVVLTP